MTQTENPRSQAALIPKSIRVYNTLTRTKEPLETVAPGKVGIYLCGPTVYKPSHIGHMVGPVIFDALKRYLAWSGYQVTLVINVTDVDDKLINEARKRNMEMPALAREMTADYMANLQAMGIDTVDHFPRATENIDEIIRFTQQLIERGFAYAADGDVYFDVAKDAEYGKLSRRKLESMLGEGGDMAERKRSPVDFALWKGAKPGEPSWPSPWGPGRPGWHIECSAMSRRLLGETFDIHGGGLDLVFPHHENEIAQSECCHGKPQARYWLHNGLMQNSQEVGKVGGRTTRQAMAGDLESQMQHKTSKSTGAEPFSELLKRFPPETIRFFVLSTHYRSPIDFSDERIQEVDTGMGTFYRLFERFERIAGESFYRLPLRGRRDEESPAGEDPLAQVCGVHRDAFVRAMDDDFNTGAAIAALFDLARSLNRFIEAEGLEDAANRGKPEGQTALARLKQAAAMFRELAATLGLFRAPVDQAEAGGDELVGKLVGLLIEVRADARKSKNFAAADKIRKSLGEMGIALEDRSEGTLWTRQR